MVLGMHFDALTNLLRAFISFFMYANPLVHSFEEDLTRWLEMQVEFPRPSNS